MAENTYRIIVDLENVANEGTGKAPVAEAEKSDTSAENLALKQKNAAKMVAVSAVKGTVNYLYTMRMQEINIVTGRTQQAQRDQFFMDAIGTVGSAAQSAMGGSMIATALGVSGPVGVGIGLLTFGITKAIEVSKKSHELYLKRYAENEQLQVLRTRSGAAFNNSRLNKGG